MSKTDSSIFKTFHPYNINILNQPSHDLGESTGTRGENIHRKTHLLIAMIHRFSDADRH